MSILTSELAIATAGEVLHCFFQDGQNILEARSADGGLAWATEEATIAKDGNYSGSAMTAHYVDKDANFKDNQTIHLMYMNQSGQLAERVKRMSGDTPIWEDVTLNDDVRKGADQNSRMTSGAFNKSGGTWNPNGSQWAYFSSSKDGKQGIVEIRRTPKDPWHSEVVLPENWGDALPGTSLACIIEDGMIQVFFQDHDYNICMYENKSNKWTSRGTYIDKKDVQPTTPLAATKTSDGKTHLFYAGMSNKIMHATDGGSKEEVIDFYPGSKIGATSVKDRVTLFYRKLNPVGEVGTLEYDGKWKQGSTVIRA